MKLRERLRHKAKSVLRSLNACSTRMDEDQQGKQSSSGSSSFVDKRKRHGLVKTILNVGHKFLVLLVRWFLKTVYGEHGQKMPPIRNLILMESASSLALKIRTRKVSTPRVSEPIDDL